MKKLALATAALMLSAAPLQAQEEPVELTQEEQERVIRDLQVLIGGLQSENVEDEVKTVLVACIYANSLKTISDEMASVLEANPQLDQTQGSQLLAVMARICGYQPQPQPVADTAPVEGR